jgi:hypothetical protein
VKVKIMVDKNRQIGRDSFMLNPDVHIRGGMLMDFLRDPEMGSG